MRLKKIDSINVLPFIDIMLVLLAIVLTTATFISQGVIKIALPEAKTANAIAPSGSQKRAEISLKENKFYFNGEAMINFYTLLLRLDSLNREDQIIFRAENDAKFGDFVKVMDALKERKLENVDIAVKKVENYSE
ncbi:MAG: biopolymer transporter ExbD [Helicobacteraceae bacterium]|jgi:biopolymer transport protein ExbD|nr:biopolymer transporter ExbD [Helicobacteraceae bacterium]